MNSQKESDLKEALKRKSPSEIEIRSEKVCPALGNVIMVDSLGNISVCCIDESLNNKIGNLRDMDIKEALDSPKLKQWIIAQEEQDKEKMGPACKECLFYKEYLK